MTLSKDQQELLNNIKQGRLDPVFFAEEFLGIRLHPGQKFWMWSTTKTQKEKCRELIAERYENPDEVVDYLYSEEFYTSLLVPANRWGKTFMIAVKHIWMLYYKIGVTASTEVHKKAKYHTFNISPVGEQAMACYSYINDILESKLVFTGPDGKKQKNICKLQGFKTGSNEATRTIRFMDNRKFKCATLGNDTKGATAIQGSFYAYGSFDECSEDPRLQLSVPRMKSRLVDMNGDLDLIGTPSSEGKSSQYYFRISRLGRKMQNGYFTFVGKMDDNIFLDKAYIERKKKDFLQNHPELYAQIFFGKFVDTGGKMFDKHEIENVWIEGVEKPPIPPQVGPRRKLIMSIDWGFAEKGDPTVGIVIDYTTAPYTILYHFVEKNADPWKMFAYVRELRNHFQCPVIMDSNAMGGTMIAKMLADIKPLIKFDYHGKKKEEGIYLLKQALSWNRDSFVTPEGDIIDKNPNFGKLRSYYIPELEEQLSWYQLEDKKIEQDYVMALMQAIHYIDRSPNRQKPRAISLRSPGMRGKTVWEP